MSLQDCYNQFGKAINESDKAAISELVGQGMSELEAVQAHLDNIGVELEEVINQATEAQNIALLKSAPIPVDVFDVADNAARSYADKNDAPYHAPPSEFANVDVPRAEAIAQEFEMMKHDPANPEVKAAYDAMIKETIEQFKSILETGLEIQFIRGADPYVNGPRDAIRDVRERNHLWVFSTRDGFGSNDTFDPVDNPLLQETEFEIDGVKLLANDVFRVVHDYFGHVRTNAGFRAKGEENAWQSHASMYSPLARRAMTTETRGQNSWVNYGPHGETNRTASTENTVFADQKIGLLPIWVSEEGRVSAYERATRFNELLKAGETGFEGAIDTQGRVELVHYSREPITRTDASRWGQGLSGRVRTEKNRILAGAPKRTFFGVESATTDGYRKERGLGHNRVVAKVAGELIYNLNRDPLNLYDGNDIISTEKNIIESGYSGYMVNTPQFGKTVALFDDVNVAQSQVFHQNAQKNTIGLHSAVEQAVLDISLPAWKNGGAAPAIEIWSKISKTAGVKKEELEWMGLEDILKTVPKAKYTREEVLNIVRENGVVVEETVADEKSSEGGFDWNEEEDLDSSNWSDRAYNFMYEYDNDDLDWMGEGNGYQWREDWYENNKDTLIEFLKNGDDADDNTAAIEAAYDAGDSISGAMYALGFDDNPAIDEMREDAEKLAEEVARDEYLDAPNRTFTEVSDPSLTIISLDGGERYRVYYNDEVVADEDIYSFNEAEVQARSFLQEEGVVSGETTHVWEEYIMEGDYDNYREIKLKLPELGGGDFSYDVHFPDDNIVAFLRVDDRMMNVAPTKHISELSAEELTPEKNDIVLEIEKTLEAEYNEEQERKAFEESKSVVDESVQASGMVATDSDKFETKMNDYTSWEGIVNLAGFDGNIASGYRRFLQNKRRLEESLQIELKKLNSPIQIAKRLNPPTTTFFIDEFQSDWHQQGRQRGYAVENPDVIEAYHAELSDLRSRHVELSGQTTGTPSPELSQEIDDVAKRIEVLHSRLQSDVPDAPFKGDAWVNLGLKRAITEAVEKGYGAIAWPNSQVLSDRWSETYSELYANQYDRKMVKFVKKLTGETPVQLNNEGEAQQHQERGYWIIPITDKLREKVQSEGYTLFQKSRGYYNPENVLIRLNEASNPSTFIHEFAHFMFDMEGKIGGGETDTINEWFLGNSASLAEEAGVPEWMVRDYITRQVQADITETDFLNIERATHEQFARGFEAYVMEGKSPSMELRNFFRVMARLLVAVYKQIKGGLDTPNLTDDMRGVFDRLIATEEQIAASEARNRAAPLFTDAVMAGMTEEQFKKYQERAQATTDKATETLRDKVMKELTRVHKKWWNDERDDFIDEAEVKLRTEPVYVARVRLKSGGDTKLDYNAVIDILGVKNLKEVPQLRGMTAKGGVGVQPEDAAKLYGFRTGDEMLSALTTAPRLQDQAEAMADAEMIDKHGDILNDGTLEQLADDAVRSEERGTVLLTEIKALARGQQVPAIDKETIKGIAAEAIGKKALKDIRPATFRRAEIRSAQEAAVALASGDKAAALRAKTQQVMNFYLWKESQEAKLFAGKMLTFAARFKKQSVRERIGKAGNSYLDNIDRILERFELRKSQSLKKHAEARDSLQSWVDKQGTQSDMIALSDAVLDESYARHWKEVPVDELRGIQDSIKSIENSAKSLNNIIINEEKLTFEQTVDRMLNKMNELPDKHFGQFKDAVDKGGIRKWHENFMTEQIKMPWMMRWLDNREEVGVMHQTVNQPLTDAYDAEVKLWNRVGKSVMQAIMNRSKEDIKRHTREVLIPEIENQATHLDGVMMGSQIIAVALNTGNKGNLKKMLAGERWIEVDNKGQPVNEADVTVDNPKLQAILKHMTESDWDLVELIWEQIGSLKPDLAAVHEKATGLQFEEVEPASFELPSGRIIEGGYYPVKYDANRSEQARLNEEKSEEQAVSMLTAGGFVQPIARTGARINRTEFTGPLRYSLDVVPQHVQEVVHFITHYDAIKQVNKLTSDPRIADAIKKKMGHTEYALIKPWLNDVAKDGRESQLNKSYNSLLRRLRFGTTYGIMGFKVSTGLIQVSGLFNSMAEVGAARTMRAARTVFAGEKSIRETWEFAKANSKVLAHRQTTMDREIKNAFVNLQGKRTLLSMAQEASMMHIALVQTYTVDLPSWYAAYDKGMETFEGDEARAFQYADWVIENVQGSGVTKDMSSIMRDKNEAVKLGTMFMTYFSALFNHNADVKRGVKAGQISPTAAVAKLMFLWTLPVIFETIMREGLGDDDDDSEFFEKVVTGTAMMPFATVPFYRDAANGLVSGFNYSASPVYGIVEGGVEAASKAARGDDMTQYRVKQASKALGVAFGVPATNQAWITFEHLQDVIVEGEELSMRHLLVTTDKSK